MVKKIVQRATGGGRPLHILMIRSRIVSSSLRNLKSIIWPRWAVSSSLQSLEIVTWRATAVPVITVAIYQREAREIWSRAITEAPAAAAVGEIPRPLRGRGIWTTLTWRRRMGWTFISLTRMRTGDLAELMLMTAHQLGFLCE
jgi:hypothetical protein